jgi:7-carboxy-7-deazaguanine synthase
MTKPTLTINEIYESIQGESTWAGERCVFVRLTFCDLRCTYCDTEYAFYKGTKRPVDEVLAEVLAHEISPIDPRVHRIMDLKTPGSGECARNLMTNIPHLTKRDEVKFVIGSREDYEFSREQTRTHDLVARCGAVLFSPIFGRIEPRQIVEWILEDKLPVRFQLQMHKFIWDPKQKGV